MSTVRAIAKASGVSRTTVSLALRDHPRISEATRRHVREVAERLGYRPDAVLGKLAANRWRSLPEGVRSTLAVLEVGRRGMSPEVLAAARQRAETLGYGLDVVRLRDFTGQREALRVIEARGIEALLLWEPDDPAFEITADLARYSVVAAPVGMKQLPFHTVSLNSYRSGRVTARRVAELGYRRPGVVSAMDFHNTNINMCLGAIRGAWEEGYFQGPMPEVCRPHWTFERFRDWFERFEPDVVLCVHGHPNVLRWLGVMGLAVPEQVGVAVALGEAKGSAAAGCFISKISVAEQAVLQLHSLTQANLRGKPAEPILHLTEPRWQDGPTLVNKV